jgi:hypothetical protein
MGIKPYPGDTSVLVEPLWERQPAETIKYYRYFIIFSGMKPSERTVADAWRRAYAGTAKEAKKPSVYFRQLARKWCWVERAAARDIWELQNSQARWMERDKDRREDSYKVGSQLLNHASRIMEAVEQSNVIVPSAEVAKDLAVAGATLQENAIPTFQLAQDQMSWVLKMLPPDKRDAVIARLMQKKQRLLMARVDEVVEGEVVS